MQNGRRTVGSTPIIWQHEQGPDRSCNTPTTLPTELSLRSLNPPQPDIHYDKPSEFPWCAYLKNMISALRSMCQEKSAIGDFFFTKEFPSATEQVLSQARPALRPPANTPPIPSTNTLQSQILPLHLLTTTTATVQVQAWNPENGLLPGTEKIR